MANEGLVLSTVLLLCTTAIVLCGPPHDLIILVDEGTGNNLAHVRISFKISFKFHSNFIQIFQTNRLFLVCYTQVFNGRRLSQRYVERSIAVIDLEECKLLCTRETSFDCKSFNYKFENIKSFP